MQCPQCQHESQEGAQFCEVCGSQLERTCPACGGPTRPEASFCHHCGAHLSGPSLPLPGPSSPGQPAPDPIRYTPPHLVERILTGQAAPESKPVPDPIRDSELALDPGSSPGQAPIRGQALEAWAHPQGERKTITALFADIQGSMALLEHLDPEEARRLIDPVLQRMIEAVHCYEGYVAQTLGDGIVALFGAPLAHEDHPQRALYAALRMQEEVQQYADRMRRERGIALQIRVGINTGEVVMRSIRKDSLRTDYVPIGHSTGLAARMEGLAPPGSILVTGPTYRLTEGYFQFKPLGTTRVKGVSQPMPIYEVLGVGPLRTKFQVAARRGLTRFVGRQGELAQLQQALERAQGGQGQVLVVGRGGGGGQIPPGLRVEAARAGELPGAGGLLPLPRPGLGLPAAD